MPAQTDHGARGFAPAVKALRAGRLAPDDDILAAHLGRLVEEPSENPPEDAVAAGRALPEERSAPLLARREAAARTAGELAQCLLEEHPRAAGPGEPSDR